MSPRKVKVRCVQCGAKNRDVETCRICGALLPGAARIREGTSDDGALNVDETIEHERAMWRGYQRDDSE